MAGICLGLYRMCDRIEYKGHGTWIDELQFWPPLTMMTVFQTTMGKGLSSHTNPSDPCFVYTRRHYLPLKHRPYLCFTSKSLIFNATIFIQILCVSLCEHIYIFFMYLLYNTNKAQIHRPRDPPKQVERNGEKSNTPKAINYTILFRV